MIHGLYLRLYKLLSRPDERDDSSSGLFQNLVRRAAFPLCATRRGRFADIGCGEGIFLDRVAGAHPGLSLYGVDLSEEMLRRARARLGRTGRVNAALVRAAADRTPFPDGYFDTVACLNVTLMLDSSRRFAATAAELSRICKNGGTVVIDFRARNLLFDLKYRLAPLYDRSIGNAPPRRTYSPSFVARTLDRHGIAIEETLGVGMLPAPLSPLVIVRGRKRAAKGSRG